MTVRVRGIRELVRACNASSKATKRLVRARLRKVAEPVRDAARDKLSKYDAGSASGFGIRVRNAGAISVEQRRRRVTGRRGDYGALQMREALTPAADENESEIQRGMEDALDDIANVFERS